MKLKKMMTRKEVTKAIDDCFVDDKTLFAYLLLDIRDELVKINERETSL